MNNHTPYKRYHRQVLLKEFGEKGQQKLLQAKVLVAGAGGLGCAALQYLAGGGVGTIGIVDDDVVSLSNLHRQVLYTTNDIGSSKAERAAYSLQQLNPEVDIIAYNKRLTTANCLEMIAAFDIVIDGTDNFSTRYMINDACVLLNKPLVYGAISKFEGQVAVFNYQSGKGTIPVNYRDLFPQPPDDNEILNCAEAGVLGVLPGIIGTMQANETIKLIAGIGKPLVDHLLTYDALTNQVYKLALTPADGTHSLIPKDAAAFKSTQYDRFCSSSVDTQFEIGIEELEQLAASGNIDIIDVRELGEEPLITRFSNKQIPLSQLKKQLTVFENDTIITFCQSGKRSLQAARYLFETFGVSKKIYSLRGGVMNFKKE